MTTRNAVKARKPSGDSKRPDDPQQPRSARTRARMLDAALALLAEEGPAAVTHRAVAERAGASLGAVTYHFPAKVDLIDEVYRLHQKRVRARARAIAGTVGTEAPDPARFAEALFHYLAQGVLEDRVGSLATFELALERARDPALRSRLRSAQRASYAFAEEQLAALGSEEPEADAALVIAALDGLRLAWLSHGERSAFAKRIPSLVERLATWLGPAGSTGERARRAR